MIEEPVLRTRTLRPAVPVFAGVLALLSAAVIGCGGSDSPSQAAAAGGDKTLKVVAPPPQVADFPRNIGGAKVTVTQILKPNVDPHDYEPSPADIQAVADAD